MSGVDLDVATAHLRYCDSAKALRCCALRTVGRRCSSAVIAVGSVSGIYAQSKGTTGMHHASVLAWSTATASDSRSCSPTAHGNRSSLRVCFRVTGYASWNVAHVGRWLRSVVSAGGTYAPDCCRSNLESVAITNRTAVRAVQFGSSPAWAVMHSLSGTVFQRPRLQTFEAYDRTLGFSNRHKQMIVISAGDHVATDGIRCQRGGNCCGQAHRIQRRVHA